MAWPWLDDAERLRSAATVEARLADAAIDSVSVIWAAGRSGMGSDEAQMQQETTLFSEVLSLAERHAASHNRDTHVHLMSSAGGLFEGRRHVDNETVPRPARPYGLGKLRQENLLLEAAARTRHLTAHIYRPSTVYGFHAGARMGLIPVLVLNALAGRTSVIAGRYDTIRDYVAADDIGRFVASEITDPSAAGTTPMLLASGRPAPIGEIVAEIEQILGTRLLLRYDPRPSNGVHMSYRKSAIPAKLAPTDFRTGICRVALKARAHAFYIPRL